MVTKQITGRVQVFVNRYLDYILGIRGPVGDYQPRKDGNPNMQKKMEVD